MASRNLMVVVAMGLVLGQFIGGVRAESVGAETKKAETIRAASPAIEAEAAEGTEGIAYYYAKRYNGRKTNSGARYNPAKLTAAHPDLPHGSKVKVINLDNRKEVVVTVNDRCRKRKVPIIDLSRAAAKQLGFLGKGSARVMIIPLEEESS